MCGISGSVGGGLATRAALAHRGPDGYRDWSSGAVSLQHWRLRILDLSESADQPMFSADGKLALIFNGEIYNAEDLKRRFFEGERFLTTSDTEVLLRMLERFGAAAIRHLRGMFAFALWNERTKRLLLARDPFGIKPLFVSEGPELCFASELPALLSMLRETPQPDHAALDLAFTFGFVPAPRTAFRGISQLLPGEIREYDEGGGLVSREVLPAPWSERTEANRASGGSLREVLADAVREQFHADVPVGVFLSGGIDSNVIVAAAREAGVEDVHTFTVRFRDALEGDSNDETADARASARFFGTRHTEVDAALGSAEELLADLDRFGQPFGNPTVYLTRLLSCATRQHVTVALAGVGGDELFGGYPRYAALRNIGLLRGPLGRMSASVARATARLLRTRSPRALRRITWAAGSGSKVPDEAYLEWAYYLTRDEKAALLPRLSANYTNAAELLRHAFRVGNEIGGLPVAGAVADLELYVPGNLLAYTDIGSMAESLEVRVPFLDPDVAYYALRALRPEHLSFRKPKALLRKLFADVLPPHVLAGKKRGFNPPLARWMRTELDPLFDSGETAAFRREFVNGEELDRMRRAHRAGVEDYSQELLIVLTTARWFSRYYG
ncbi:MAG: asparagine synthase (glutamine-hydrolyzing) [Thermoanaerobaculia bacterium]